MEIEFVTYFYAGRIYQYYLDNEKDLVSGKIKDFGFLVPKKEGIEITKLKKLVKVFIEKDGIVVKCSSLPKRNGWRFGFSMSS